MINIKKLFADLPNKIFHNQRKLDIDTKVKVYYGYSKEGLLRVSFLIKLIKYFQMLNYKLKMQALPGIQNLNLSKLV